MILENLKVVNFKGLKEIEIPVSNFVCVIGENNAGKSSLLQAILLFLNNPKINKSVYYDPNSDILITATFSGITESVLEKIAEEHRERIAAFIENGRIKLARRYSTDCVGKLRLVKKVPSDEKYDEENIVQTFKGKRGETIVETLKELYPEVVGNKKIENTITQNEAKSLISEYIRNMSPEQFVERDVSLPTGIDNSIKAILPEPVYIPAVKDLTDEIKTKESASFGKLLNILLNVIEDDLIEDKDTFEQLRKKLNRIVNSDGTVSDYRIEKVREIEKTIQRNLDETFKNIEIELQIPPPDIKTILSSASIYANDGVRGPIDNKGDGVKRAITFSILKSYVQLSQNKDWRKPKDVNKTTKEKFIFLFEEPELYLHPKAQDTLFDALTRIVDEHQILVTTHSPHFFSHNNTKTFIKIVKEYKTPAPISRCITINLDNISERDKFQIISFESANAAFFSNKIVLVEGDSEAIILPHISYLLDPYKNLKSQNVALVRVAGKGSFKRYKEFFDKFSVPVSIFADLDVIVRDFDKVDPSPEVLKIRKELLAIIDKIIDDENKKESPNPRLLKEALQKERARKLYDSIKEARSNGDNEKVISLLEELFIFEKTEPQMEVLKDHTYTDVLNKKRQLLAELRKNGVFILERGAIESYYPEGIGGQDKPTKAQTFCRTITTREQVLGISDELPDMEGKTEMEVIFEHIFDSANSPDCGGGCDESIIVDFKTTT